MVITKKKGRIIVHSYVTGKRLKGTFKDSKTAKRVGGLKKFLQRKKKIQKSAVAIKQTGKKTFIVKTK